MVDVYFTRGDIALVASIIIVVAWLGFWVGSNITVKPTFTKTINLTNTVYYPTTVTETKTLAINRTVTVTLPGGVVTTTVTKTTTTTVVSFVTFTSTTVVYNVTTVTTTSTSYVPFTLTTTTTIVENASQLPPLNMSDPGSILAYIKDDFSLGMAGLANLSLPLGYCIGTMWILPNASVVYLGAWFIPQNIAQKMMSNYAAVYTFPKTGIKEYVPYVTPSLAVLNYAGNTYGTFGADTYLININYPGNGYIVGLYGSNIVGSLPPWGLTVSTGTYQLLSNGTYIMALVNSSIPSLMQLVLNPPGLCLIQVIRVKPGTPDSYILNMTYWGAQYVAWVVSEAIWGKPAPCYVPWAWTYGYVVYRINITEPIGSTWEYYCGPKGIWLPLKP
ncbi:MAG: hypothetical protein RXN91_04070 [Caldivirga sp.]